MHKESLLTHLNKQPFVVNEMAVAIEILKTYNCRAGEVLSARWADYHKDQFLVLQGLKGSSNVIIRDRFILQLIDELPKLDVEKIFPSINYYKLYRHCKSHYSHLFKKFKKRKYYKVTHGFRYRAVEKVANDKQIRDILQHRSINSGKYYKQK